MPPSVEPAGMKKKWRNGFRHAVRKQQAGIAMVPTSLAGFVVSLGMLPRALATLGPVRTLVLGLVVLAGGHLWLAYFPAHAGYARPGLLNKSETRRACR